MQRILVALMLLVVGGCASFERMTPPPGQQQGVAVSVSETMPSAMNDMTIGVYQVPDSRVYISGHQRGQAASLMFGLLGAAIAHGANQERGKGLVGDSDKSLKYDLVTATNGALAAKLKQHGEQKAFMAADGKPAKGSHNLSVIPYVVLTYTSDILVRPFVVLKASMQNPAGTEIWWSRYVSVVLQERPLTGEKSWSQDDGKPLKEAVARALDDVADVVARDVVGKLPRSAAREVNLKARYVFVQQELDLPGQLVESNGNSVIFIPKVGDVVVFAGVNIFPRELVKISDTPAAGASASASETKASETKAREEKAKGLKGSPFVQ
jgi:hypothetical protein